MKNFVKLLNKILNNKGLKKGSAPKEREINKGLKIATRTTHKFTENRQLPIRAASHSGGYYLEKARKCWDAALVTMPFDLVFAFSIIQIPIAASSAMRLNLLAYLCLGISCLGFYREALLGVLDLGRVYYLKITKRTQRYSWIALFLVVGTALFEVGSRFKASAIIVILVCLAAGWRGIQAGSEMIKQQKLKRASLDADRTLLVDQINQTLFLTSILPPLSARLASLLFSITSFQYSDQTYLFASQLLLTWLILIALCPQIEHFEANCPKCSRKTSRGLRYLGYCPECAREEFQVKK